MFGCLKDNRAILQPICRAAVLQRQAAAAEDISLDPDLARECKNDRVRLCKHTSWGEGAARDCLVGRLLRGLTDELYSTLDLALVSTGGLDEWGLQ